VEDAAIGELALEWNWLVGEYAYSPGAKIVHYTIGGPYFAAYRDCDYAGEWFAEFESMRQCGVGWSTPSSSTMRRRSYCRPFPEP